MAKYKKGDIVLLPFPFLTSRDIKRKLRPALVVSDHTIPKRYNDLILLAITSKQGKKQHRGIQLISPSCNYENLEKAESFFAGRC